MFPKFPSCRSDLGSIEDHHGRHCCPIRHCLKSLARSLEREGRRRQGLSIEESRLDQSHESRNIAHRIRAGQVARLMTLGAIRPLICWNRHDAPWRMAPTERDDMTHWRTQLPCLLQRQYARRIRPHFCFRPKQIAANCLYDEIGSDVAATGQPSVRPSLAQLLDSSHEVVAFDVWIEGDRRAQCEGGLAPVTDRIDNDDLRWRLDPCTLHTCKPDRTRT